MPPVDPLQPSLLSIPSIPESVSPASVDPARSSAAGGAHGANAADAARSANAVDAGLEAARSVGDAAAQIQDAAEDSSTAAALRNPLAGLHQTALDRPDLAGLVSRFTAAAARHPAGMPAAAADLSTIEGREAAEVNKALERAQDYTTQYRTATALRSTQAELHTPRAKELRTGIEALFSAADQKGSGAQCLGAVYAAGLMQASADVFASSKAMSAVATDLQQGVLLLMAAETKADADAAMARINDAFAKLDQAEPQSAASPEANEVRTVLHEAVDLLASQKADALGVMNEVSTTPEGAPDIHGGDFGFRTDESGHVSTDASTKLRAFGGVMNPARDAAAAELEKLEREVDRVQDAVQDGMRANIREVCGELNALDALNPAAAAAVAPQATALAQKVVTEELAELFGVDPAAVQQHQAAQSSQSAQSPQSIAPQDAIGLHIDWQAINADDQRAAQVLLGVNDALSEVRPQGSLGVAADPDLMKAVLPYQAVREEALASLLADSPLVSDAVKSQADAIAAAAAPGASPLEAAMTQDARLAKLQEGLAASVALRGAGTIADELLAQYAIDADHPMGGMRGGLAGLAGRLALSDFTPETLADGSVKKPAYDSAVFKTTVDKVADGLAAQHPAVGTALHAEAQAFLDAASPAEREAHFNAAVRILAVAGALGDDLTEIAPAGDPNVQGTPESREAALCALLADPDQTKAAAHAGALLKTALAAPEAGGFDKASAFAAALDAMLARTESGSPASRAAHGARLAAEYASSLALNDFFTNAVNGASRSGASLLALSELRCAADPDSAVAQMLAAADAFRADPKSGEMLRLLSGLTAINPDQLKAELLELAESKAQSDPAQADAYRQEAEYLLGQFEALKSHADVMLYAAHALYAAENPGVDAGNIDRAAAQNQAFHAQLQSVFAGRPKDLARFESLMRPGVRGAGLARAAASKMALASLKASAAAISRSDLAQGFGVEHQVNAARSLRWYLMKADPTRGYITEMNVAKLAAEFRAAAAKDPVVRALMLADSAEVREAEGVVRPEAEKLERALGVDQSQIERIEHGVTAQEGVRNPQKLAKMHGQTAGMALHVLNAALINSPDDMPSEAIGRFVGRLPAQTAEGHYELSSADLLKGAQNAASTPFAQREAAVFLKALMDQDAAAAGRALTVEEVLDLHAPKAPSDDDLSRLSDDEKTARLADHQAQAQAYEALRTKIRIAYEAHAEPAAKASGTASLAELSAADQAKLIDSLKGKALEKTLAAGESDAQKAAAQETLEDLGKALRTGANAAELAKMKRQVGAQLAQRAARGRYVLSAKLHDAANPSAGNEFDEAWKKLKLSGDGLSAGALERLKASLARSAQADFGQFSRLEMAATGAVGTAALKAQVLSDASPQTKLALQTAVHCALEDAADNCGTTVGKLLTSNSSWQHRISTSKLVNISADQTEILALIAQADQEAIQAGKGPGKGKVKLADLVAAHLKSYLPPEAVGAYMQTLQANNAKGARQMSRSMTLRDQRLRKAKYFEGLAHDLRAVRDDGASFLELRGARAAHFSERQRGLYAQCLEGMMPGDSVAIDKKGHIAILGAEKKAAIESQKAGESQTTSVSAELSAELGVDLTDALVITKKTDGGVTVSVTKGIAAKAEFKAAASAGAAQSFDAGSLEGEASIGISAEASAGVSVGGKMGVERDFSVKDAADFLDRLLSGKTTEADLNEAVLSAAVSVEANISVGVSVSAALGFETSEEETEIEPQLTTQNADGSVTTMGSETDENGAVSTVTTTTFTDGSSVKDTVVTDKGGSVSERSTAMVDADGNRMRTSTEQGVSYAFAEGFGDQAEKLNVSAQASITMSGEVGCTRTSRSTPTERQTEYAFSGKATISASVSVEHEGLSAAADLAGVELELEKKAEATWNIENVYTITDDLVGRTTTSVSKSTTCAISEKDADDQANINQLKNLIAAQHLPQQTAAALESLLLTADVEPNSVTFGYEMPAAELEAANKAAGRMGVTVKTAVKSKGWQLTGITLGFSQETGNTKLLSRIVNAVGGVMGGAVELSSAVTRGASVEIDVEALERITPEAVKAGLSRL